MILGAAQIAGVIRDCNWSDSTDVNNDLQGHRMIGRAKVQHAKCGAKSC